ncbi:unnamed protein product [Amoebophrya sp. A120]|nr:unnamed protein product [Amoebophrya sp. A120]|eukprot:GSA120T00005705001.1
MGNCFSIVSQDQILAVENCGKFTGTKMAGCQFLGCDIGGCCINTRTLSMRIKENKFRCETKTADNVFVTVQVAVQVQIMQSRAEDAFYKLSAPEGQIESYVTNVIRSQVPLLELDSVFEKKDSIAEAVKKDLTEQMNAFGYSILNVLVVDVDPESSVKDAMNKINAAKRLRVAATDEAEAQKVRMVKAAEAEADSQELQGQGIARQRSAIVEGLRASIGSGKDADRVAEMLLITQYFETMQKVANGRSTTVFVPSGVEGVTNTAAAIRQGVLESNYGTLTAPLPRGMEP